MRKGITYYCKWIHPPLKNKTEPQFIFNVRNFYCLFRAIFHFFQKKQVSIMNIERYVQSYNSDIKIKRTNK